VSRVVADLVWGIAVWASPQAGTGLLEVTETGQEPERKVALTSPGTCRAVLWQASGGGIMEFYDLGADPEAKVNLAGWDRGLFEVGWHGQTFKSPEGGDCCAKHVLDGKKDAVCYDGCADWPSIGHKALKAQGTLEVIEKSAARVRVRAESVFVWWSKFANRDMPITAVGVGEDWTWRRGRCGR